MIESSNALIIGGGVIGASIAWELLQKGITCTLIDKGAFCREASTASAGMLCPQAEILDSIDSMEIFTKSQSVHRAWTENLEEHSGISVQYVDRGMIRLLMTEEQERAAKVAIAAAKTDIRFASADEIYSMEPEVVADIRGGIVLPHDAQLHPIHLARSLRAALERAGCTICEWIPALSLIVDGSRVTGVRTSAGDFYADSVIMAAGAWSSALMSPLNLEIPVVPVKGQLYAVKSSSLSIHRTIQGPGGVIIPRLDGSFTVGVTHLECGFDKRPTVNGIAQIYEDVVKFIPNLKDTTFACTWAGLRPGTPDGLPYIGKADGVEGLFIATGHYTVGILLAPITAMLISQLVTGVSPMIDLMPFHPLRFVGKSAARS